MESSEFAARVGLLTGGEIAAIAAALRQEHDSADGEVAWWRATVAVTGTLRRRHCTRQASVAAHAVAEAVRRAAERAGLAESDRTLVTMVARAAADVARALVAIETSCDSVLPVDQLFAPWAQLDPVAA